MPVIRKPLTVVELYAGTARSASPFAKWERARIGALIDRDQYAAATYRLNFPTRPYFVEDIATITPDRVVSLAGARVDVLLGCPPCQGFSDTGTRDPQDDRNKHLLRFGALAVALKPLAIVMENVPLAISAAQFAIFTRRLAESGYVWTAGVVNAALRGSAQCRQRLVLVAIHRRVGATPRFPRPSYGGKRQYFSYHAHKMMRLEDDRQGMLGEAPASQRTSLMVDFQEKTLGKLDAPNVGEVLEGLPRIGTVEAAAMAHVPWAHSRAQLARMARVPEGGRWRGGMDHFAQTYGRLHRRGLARTITTQFNNPGSGRFWHPTAERAITVREAARIQGFPDSFRFFAPYSRAASLIGNALDGAVARLTYNIVSDILR